MNFKTLKEDDLPCLEQIPIQSIRDIMATHPFDPDKYRQNRVKPTTDTQYNPPIRVQQMIDTSLEPIKTRLDNLEQGKPIAVNATPQYYRQKRKTNDTINRIFLLDNDNIVHFIFNAVEDVATPTLLGWRLWQPHELKNLSAYDITVRADGKVLMQDVIYKTADEVEDAALAIINTGKINSAMNNAPML